MDIICLPYLVLFYMYQGPKSYEDQIGCVLNFVINLYKFF